MRVILDFNTGANRGRRGAFIALLEPSGRLAQRVMHPNSEPDDALIAELRWLAEVLAECMR